MFSLERIQYNFHVLWNFWNVRWFDTFWNHFTELFHQSCPIGWEKKNSKQNFEKSKLEASVVRFFFLPDGFIGHVGEGVATASFVLVGGVDWFNPPDGVAMNGVATRWLHRRPIYGAVIRVGSRGFQAETDSSVAFVSASAAFQVVDYSWTLNQSPKRRLVEKKTTRIVFLKNQSQIQIHKTGNIKLCGHRIRNSTGSFFFLYFFFSFSWIWFGGSRRNGSEFECKGEKKKKKK